jgi:hypothetical protein
MPPPRVTRLEDAGSFRSKEVSAESNSRFFPLFDDVNLRKHSHGKIHPFSRTVNHLFLWAIYTMAMLNSQRVNVWIYPCLTHVLDLMFDLMFDDLNPS